MFMLLVTRYANVFLSENRESSPSSIDATENSINNEQ